MIFTFPTDHLWPNMIMLFVLQTFYEVTSDPRVLPFMEKYSQYQFEIPKDRLMTGVKWMRRRASMNGRRTGPMVERTTKDTRRIWTPHIRFPAITA